LSALTVSIRAPVTGGDRPIARIERLCYRTAFVERLGEAARLPTITFEAADLPDDVVALVDAHLLDLGATYGDPEADVPIQHDELRTERPRRCRDRRLQPRHPAVHD